MINDIYQLRFNRAKVFNLLTDLLSQPGKEFDGTHIGALSFPCSGEFRFDERINRGSIISNLNIDCWFIPKSPNDLINYILMNYINAGIHFRKCEYCERYFALMDGYKSEYCTRTIEGLDFGKTCRAHGKILRYGKKVKNDPVRSYYTRSYRAHNARVKNGIMSRDEFDVWAKKAQEMRDKCIQGQISLEEMKAWLDQDKKRKREN